MGQAWRYTCTTLCVKSCFRAEQEACVYTGVRVSCAIIVRARLGLHNMARPCNCDTTSIHAVQTKSHLHVTALSRSWLRRSTNGISRYRADVVIAQFRAFGQGQRQACLETRSASNHDEALPHRFVRKSLDQVRRGQVESCGLSESTWHQS